MIGAIGKSLVLMRVCHERKRPLNWTDVLAIVSEQLRSNPSASKRRMEEQQEIASIVSGVEIEARGRHHKIDWKTLPNTIFELNHCISSIKSDGEIDFNTHFVINSNKKLA